jgi:hypothetical protein
MTKQFLIILSMALLLAGCIKDSDYTAAHAYQTELKSIKVQISPDSIPADGNTQAKIDILVLPDDTKDSINLAGFNFTVTTTLGTFSSNNQSTITLGPSFKLDSTGTKRQYIAEMMLVSGTKSGKAIIKIKYSNVEVDTTMRFYLSYPDRLRLSASSLSIAPDFKTEDTINVQLSSATGLPSSGSATTLSAYDSTGKKPLGLFRVANNKSNASGLCSFIFVLGDSTINGNNYRGAVNFEAAAFNGTDSVKTNLTIYSR